MTLYTQETIHSMNFFKNLLVMRSISSVPLLHYLLLFLWTLLWEIQKLVQGTTDRVYNKQGGQHGQGSQAQNLGGLWQQPNSRSNVICQVCDKSNHNAK